MLQEDYHITLDAFKGPLDLLLFLIRRAEVEITDIPIHEITEQYVAFLKEVDAIDIETAAEFLVMAATLVEIKSRVLQHRKMRNEAGEGASDDLDLNLDESDPRYELVQQLLAYQRYRDAAERLDHLREEYEQRFPAAPGRRDAKQRAEIESQIDEAHFEVELEDAHVFDLFDAYERIIESVDFSRLGEHEVQDTDTPIGLHQEDLVDRLSRAPGKRITLQEAWLGRSRGDVIGLFLATLELVRQRRVTAVQDDIHGEIMLELNDDPDATVVEAEVEFKPQMNADQAD